ncbi:YbaY family lipoprotein [Caenibius sp. WL]|uniref:YbaY family lipoprotein n=1 Tax=Caenibius sp. WL TaxID=2872646 RepID=UPI001C9900AC|nr:YbaY family lipoprotein [Caenibius sp. WL]QZP08399.1 YbaY family lipoprotein [Caenibius sp. WL]
MISTVTRFCIPLILAAAATACAPVPAAAPDGAVHEGMATVSGSVLYRERMLPPPGASITIALLDVSYADAPSTTITSQTRKLDGKGPPYTYRLEAPRAKLQSRMRYAVQAMIHDADGGLLWVNDAANSVDPTLAEQELPPIVLVKTGR